MCATDTLAAAYRITTNGLRYRVEHSRIKRRGVYGMRFCRRETKEWIVVPKYYDLGIGISLPNEFPNMKLACNFMRRLIAEERARRRGWHPVEEADHADD